jgi:hypothetical protein
MSALDEQIGGNHYKEFKIQPIEFLHQNNIPWCDGNVIKYVCRHRAKNGLQDLLKAKHYLEVLIEMEYGKAGTTPAAAPDYIGQLREMARDRPPLFKGSIPVNFPESKGL